MIDVTRRVDSIITIAMAAAALTLCGSYLYRTVSAKPADSTTVLRKAEWSRVLAVARPFAGESKARVTIVVFTDLQCPVCKSLHLRTLTPLLSKYPRELRILLLHYPLSYHANAMAAAKATECIASADELRRWLDIVFEKQDSLPSKSFGAFALDAGIRDTATVAACAIGEGRTRSIDQGIALGGELKIRGTPTVLIDGRMFAAPPTLEEIDSIVVASRREKP